MPTVVLNLTQKISAIIRPLRQSLPSERSLRSAHRLSAEPRSKTNTCGPMSTRKGQAASVTLLRREQLRSASAPARCGGSLRERADRVVRPYRAFRTASGERFSVRRRRADEGVSGIRRVRSNEPPVTADEIVCGYQRIFAPTVQFEKLEIHTVFLRFSNFHLRQNLSLITLANLIIGYSDGKIRRWIIRV